MTKFIIGSGISGLIFKYYNPEYEIISPDIKAGGQLTKHKNLMTTFHIHNTEETKKLLNDLGIKYTEKRLKIYYYYYGQLLDSITKEQRLRFIKNKMCEYDYDSNSVNVSNLNLSTENSYLDILKCDVNEVINKLSTETIFGEVKLINNNRKFFVYKDKEGKLIKQNYDKLISTIPANFFFNILYNYKCEYYLNYLPATFVFSNTKQSFMKDEDAIYYVLDDNIPYNRIQAFNGGYVYETTGLMNDEDISKYIPDVVDVEKRYVGIIKDEKIENFKYIKFLGRTAQWFSNVKIQDVIRESLR